MVHWVVYGTLSSAWYIGYHMVHLLAHGTLGGTLGSTWYIE